ncbi:allantoate amidohydrolase [Alsobacter soli]|uniref:Allantoate amidohydrolase n=1 Tax=Alsobacter soli TaxID=2109933 RepID=A0A2T1HPD1_9HYPH|nr:allantoate amidohydrolase [Alsobacter soli]PSC03505.1 allantoate amidohydrolase [Alsobacter soli]
MTTTVPHIPLAQTPGSRAMARLDALRAFTDVPGQIHRLYLSASHRQAADAVAAMMRDAGCDSVGVDALGAVVGRYEGTEPGQPALLIGSHIDTVKDAGAYDGTLGVIAAIAVIEELARTGERLPFAIEALAFGDEENVRFPSNLSSSRALAGKFDVDTLDGRDEDGVTLRDALVAFGGDPAGIPALARDPAGVLAYVEVHIEQGPVLEVRDLPVGVVSAINGASRRRLAVTGEAGHAGTVPMGLRRDALSAAAEMALAIERLGAAQADTVATVGRFVVEPGAVNVIPGRVQFTLDARSPDDAVRMRLVERCEAECRAIAARRGVTLAVEPFYDASAAPCDPAIRAGLAAAVAGRQIPVLELPSGAGHDAMAMADLCPVGMLFVRCKGGISHNPAESMTEADADAAIAVLLDFVRAFRR